MKLRPVTFYYKPEFDKTQTRQFGLVAEEVAQVAPQLVVFDKDGAPQMVRYHFVNAMLLNEVQAAAATGGAATESERRTEEHHRAAADRDPRSGRPPRQAGGLAGPAEMTSSTLGC
jgi:hypothetical protein